MEKKLPIRRIERMKNSFPDFLTQPVDDVAKQLLGCIFVREIDGEIVRVRIVETESYDQDDEASHTFRGQTMRNAAMFGEAGHMYVYFTYGMHYCCNVVSCVPGYGSGVLIRAVEPLDGVDVLEKRRGVRGINCTNGPAKLCQALGIDLRMNGHDLRQGSMKLITGALQPNEEIATSSRVGISRAKDALRRYYIKDNPYVSRHK